MYCMGLGVVFAGATTRGPEMIVHGIHRAGQLEEPVLFCPRSSLANLKGLVRKAALSLALSFCLLLGNTALHRVKSCFPWNTLRTARSALSPCCFILPLQPLKLSNEAVDLPYPVAGSICRWCRLRCLGSKPLSCESHNGGGHCSQLVIHIPLAVTSRT